MRSAARALVLVGVACLAIADAAEAARRAPRPHFVIEPSSPIEDEPVWVCAVGAPSPRVVNLDGLEETPAVLYRSPLDSGAPRPINLSLRWPASGPLALHRAIDARPRADTFPVSADAGWLGPGRYVLHAPGFVPETLIVHPASIAERRSRATLARARRYAAAGDSIQAVRLLESLLARDPGGPYATATYLALGELLPYTRWRARPADWIGEWIARRLGDCVLEEGVRVWLASGGAAAREELSKIVSRYPGTPAAEVARRQLARGEPDAPAAQRAVKR